MSPGVKCVCKTRITVRACQMSPPLTLSFTLRGEIFSWDIFSCVAENIYPPYPGSTDTLQIWKDSNIPGRTDIVWKKIFRYSWQDGCITKEQIQIFLSGQIYYKSKYSSIPGITIILQREIFKYYRLNRFISKENI